MAHDPPMPEPWDPDHGLSRAELAACLTTSLEKLAESSHEDAPDFPETPDVRWFDEGWDCDVFVVPDRNGTRWLCKVPKRSNVQPWLHREALVLKAFEEAKLGFVPSVGWTSWSEGDWRAGNSTRVAARESQSGSMSSDPALPYDWMAISFVPGVPLLHRLDQVDPSRLGRSYGDVLREVHGVSPGGIGERPALVTFDPSSLITSVDSAIDALRRHVASDVVVQVQRMVERVRERRSEEVAPVFIHGDLFPEHVFADPETWNVIGLIDWADSSWGDPAADFCLLGWLLGDRFLDAAMDSYCARPAAMSEARVELRRRAVVKGAVIGIHDIEVAEKGAPNVPLRQRIEVLERRAREGWLERV